MAYIGNPPAPQNITSSEIADGTIVNVDIASDAAIAATKIAGLSTVATTGAYADVTGTPTLGTAAAAATGDFATAAQGTLADAALPKAGGAVTGDVTFGDSKKAIFGAGGSDLQIFHDSSNSYIKEVGAGDLIIMGDSVNIRNAAFDYALKYDTNAAVTLYYDNAAKIATSASGISVTGRVAADFLVPASNQTDPNDGSSYIYQQSGVGWDFAALNLKFSTGTSGNRAERMRIADTGVDVTGELIAASYNETYAAVTSSSNATTVNCHAGNSFSHVLTENTTFTFSNPPASGTSYTFSIEIIQDSGASGFAVTWPSSVDWPAATAPTLTATASAKDIFVFTSRDGGTNWYGFTAAQALG